MHIAQPATPFNATCAITAPADNHSAFGGQGFLPEPVARFLDEAAPLVRDLTPETRASCSPSPSTKYIQSRLNRN